MSDIDRVRWLWEQTERERDALRAVLAPLLDQPMRSTFVGHPAKGLGECVFCRSCHPDRSQPPTHAPDCPVLRKDELLGLVPTVE